MKYLLNEVLRSSVIVENEDLTNATVKYALRHAIILNTTPDLIVRIAEKEQYGIMRILIQNKVLIKIDDEEEDEKGADPLKQKAKSRKELSELQKSIGGTFSRERYINESDFLKVIINKYEAHDED